MMSGPYLASEDSAFLREALEGYRGETCLEIGAGNAGNLVELAGRFTTVVGTDVLRPAMGDWKKKGVDFILTDVASCLRDSCFDLVALNPPYLREEGTGDRTVEGGLDLGLPKRFLGEALRVVRPDGRVVMLLNEDAAPAEFEAEAARRGFRMKKISSRRLFFEELTIYELSAAA